MRLLIIWRTIPINNYYNHTGLVGNSTFHISIFLIPTVLPQKKLSEYYSNSSARSH